MANEPTSKANLAVAAIGCVGILGAAWITRGGADKPAPAPVTQINVAPMVQVHQVQAIQVAPQVAPQAEVARPIQPAVGHPTRSLAPDEGTHCWAIRQVQEVGTHVQGQLSLKWTGTSGTGKAQFQGHPEATVEATFASGQVTMVMRYPNGVVGNYEGTLGPGGDFFDGWTGANTGARARWTGRQTPCR